MNFKKIDFIFSFFCFFYTANSLYLIYKQFINLIFRAMKKLALILILSSSQLVNGQTRGLENPGKGFDFDLFQKTLIEEMGIQFEWMKEDTTISEVASSRNSKESNYHPCHVTKKGGMVDLEENEIDQAKRLVSEYKEYLYNSPYFGGEKALRKYYSDFSAIATEQLGGLIRYGIVVDNNISRESLTENVIYPEETIQ